MGAWGFAVVWVGLIATAGVPPPGHPTGGDGVVVVDRLEILDEPDASAYASGELKRGDKVAVVGSDGSGHWLAIVPPTGSFDWVDASSIQPGKDATATVIADRSTIRSGASQAKMPGPPRRSLSRGTVVRLLDRAPLQVGQGAKARTWRAIEPPSGELRYVEAGALKREPGEKAAVPDLEPTVKRTSIGDPQQVVPPGIAIELEPIDALRRSILRRRIEDWDLEAVRQQYENLLKRLGDNSSEASVVRDRLAQVAREARLGETARRFDDLIRASRRRDAEVAQIRQDLIAAQVETERGYDARGLLQASSRRVDGQKVHALIGPEGVPIAYLSIPPGIPTSSLLARKVGVRGKVHFNESLGARLITVRDLDPLDKHR